MQKAWRAKDNGTPVRERNELRLKLKTAESERALERNQLNQKLGEVERRLEESAMRESAAKARISELQLEIDSEKTNYPTYHDQSADKDRLREAQAEIDRLQQQLQQDVIAKDERLQSMVKKEHELRERLRRAKAEETFEFNRQDLQAQLDDAELELQAVQSQLNDRSTRLQASLQREEQLRSKIKNLRASASDNERTADDKHFAAAEHSLQTIEKRHQGELKGLVKQIEYLRAKCTREETFRADLVFVKKWFLMQVSMYNAW